MRCVILMRSILGGVAMVLLAAVAAACGSSSPAYQASLNWSGMAVTGGHYSMVTATWRQPAIEVRSGTPTDYHFFVGLGGAVGSDGMVSPHSEQIVTGSRLHGGTTVCSAWWDMHPKPNVPIKMVIKPGDLVTATVAGRGGGDFVLTLSDRTSGQSFKTKQIDPKATRDSAEIIADLPRAGNVGAPPNALNVHFTRCQVDGRPLGDVNPTSVWLTNSYVGGTPSDLGSDKASFSIAFEPASAP